MSGTKGPPPGKGKPFLQDDDLLAELDAWDQTFDALHGPDELDAARGQEPAPPPMEWPTPSPDLAVGDRTALTSSDDMARTHFDAEIDLEEQLTLDGAMEETADREYPRVSSTMPDEMLSESETDFTDIGGAAAPAALGPLVGRSSSAPPMHEDDPGDRTRVRRAAKTMPPPMDDDDDGVYTSA